MLFKQRLENEYCKATIHAMVNEICEEPNKMDELMQVFVEGPLRITQRAAWPLGFIAQKDKKIRTPKREGLSVLCSLCALS